MISLPRFDRVGLPLIVSSVFLVTSCSGTTRDAPESVAETPAAEPSAHDPGGQDPEDSPSVEPESSCSDPDSAVGGCYSECCPGEPLQVRVWLDDEEDAVLDRAEHAESHR